MNNASKPVKNVLSQKMNKIYLVVLTTLEQCVLKLAK